MQAAIPSGPGRNGTELPQEWEGIVRHLVDAGRNGIEKKQSRAELYTKVLWHWISGGPQNQTVIYGGQVIQCHDPQTLAYTTTTSL
ncbi:hypothetical protein SKAU_G00177190 [Synaphobranchus kaupii]|uniref:Uncharacterized protein n=1 Tax=Synaphobranchus kaupii TaxID=118154 RepID=A0A9Q1FM66_SYNKA|nr:hypothetical protein SKAU_G00177190 [Synaphobranchus kaupii]